MIGDAATVVALFGAVTGTRHSVETVALGGNVYRHTLTPQPLSASMVGDRIKRARKALGWSPGRAADRSCLDRDRYMSIESGAAETFTDLEWLASVERIAAAFGLPLSDLTEARA